MSDKHICLRCGEKYDWENQTPPEGATFHWVPTCPQCGESMTCNPADRTWMGIIGTHLDRNDEKYEERRERVHYHARLCEGRLCISKDELVERAKHFDERADVGGWRVGPTRSRNIAFRLRKQAREKSD